MLLQQQLASSSAAPRQQPIQIMVNNQVEAHSTQQVTAPSPAPPPEPPREPHNALEAIGMFFSSPMNRLGLFSAIGIALYILQGRLSHRWRMEEMQRRVDANLFLRFTQAMPSSVMR